MKNIFLIGFMGTGKSTVASCLSSLYGMKVLEMDARVAEQEGMSIPDIFAQKGETYFRDVETQLLTEIEPNQGLVISCGGGVVLREENVHKMREKGCIVLLGATPETILERVRGDKNRPLLSGKQKVSSIREMMENRRLRYEGAAERTIQTDGKSAEEIAKEIMEGV